MNSKRVRLEEVAEELEEVEYTVDQVREPPQIQLPHENYLLIGQ